MKVLSMIQPWASLFVFGESGDETRSWKTNYRGPMAIHTSKKINNEACSHKAIQALLARHGCTPDSLPTGKIIATCTLVNCIQVLENDGTCAILENGRVISGNQYILGDYDVGNFAWEVEDMSMLEAYIHAKGRLGLWDYPI